MPKRLILLAIRLYQKTFSFDHGLLAYLYPYGYCRFRPTCSEYAYLAVKQYGVIKGSYLGVKRLLKCHPFNKGGHDPVR